MTITNLCINIFNNNKQRTVLLRQEENPEFTGMITVAVLRYKGQQYVII